MQKEPAVCVLMATYNGRPWIDEQLDSILNQIDVRVHVLISDDASSDGLRPWLYRRAADDGRLHILRNDLRFGNAARNFYHLLAQAPIDHFEYFALADQDDIWDADKLIRHIRLLAVHTVDAVSSDVTAFWPSGKRVLIRKSWPQRRWDHLFEPPGPGCSFLLRTPVVVRCRSFLEDLEVRGIQPMPYHDWMIYLVARASGMRWWIDPQPSLLYRQHGRNEVGAHVGWKATRARLERLARGNYRGLVEQAMRLAAIAADDTTGERSPSRLAPARVLFDGRRHFRDAIVATLFMPLGVKARRGNS